MTNADCFLIVWAIKHGRGAAAEVDEFLMGATRLPRQGSLLKRGWAKPPIGVKGGALDSVSEVGSDRPSMDSESTAVAAAA